jgi:Protein of unknown function (DUF2442)
LEEIMKVNLTDAEIERVRQETAARDRSEPRARSAHFDRASGRLVLELTNGVTVLVPADLLQGVAGAAPELIEEVEVTARGYGLHWPTLDADLAVPAIVSGIFGTRAWMAQLAERGQLAAVETGRRGSRKASSAKAAAMRTTGRKSGQPRKVGQPA